VTGDEHNKEGLRQTDRQTGQSAMIRLVQRKGAVTCLIYLKIGARCQWLMPIILATWEAEIRRIRFEARLGSL
jgi:hypothetical protein